MCVDLTLVKIGCSESNKIDITNDINESVNTSLSQSISQFDQNTTASVNDFKFNLCGDTECSIDVVQTNKTTEKVAIQMTSENAAQISNSITNGISNKTNQAITNGVLAFLAQNGNQSNSTQMTNRVKIAVSSAVNQNTLQQAAFNEAQTNQFVMNVCCKDALPNCAWKGPYCDFSQQNSLSAQISAIFFAAQSAVSNDKFLNQLANAASQTQGDGTEFLQIMQLIGIAIVGVIVVIVILVIAKALSSRSSS